MTMERSYFQIQCKDSAVVVQNLELSLADLKPSAPCLRDVVMHYSFDMGQQIMYPCNPLQPGPIYLMVPQKWNIWHDD